MDYCANRKWSLCHLCWCNLLDNRSDVEIQLYQTFYALIDLYTQISSVTCCWHLSPRNKPTHPEQYWDGLMEGVLFIGGFHWILLLWSYFVSFEHIDLKQQHLLSITVNYICNCYNGPEGTNFLQVSIWMEALISYHNKSTYHIYQSICHSGV